MVDTVIFCHLSDSHLGYFQYNLEERARDFGKALDDAFSKVAREKPDFIIYTGDLFHDYNPKPMALHQFILAYNRHIRPLKIPMLFSAGNHDVSRIQSQSDLGTIYDVLHYFLEHCIFVSDEVIEVESDEGKPLALVLGMRYYKKDTIQTFRELIQNNKDTLEQHGDSVPRITMLHAYIDGLHIQDKDVNEDDLARAGKFDYIGIGHWHQRKPLDSLKIYYPGATEHTSSNEWENKPGFNVVEMSRDEHWTPKVRFVELENIRPKKIVEIEVTRASAQEVQETLRKNMRENNLEGALIQYTLNGTTTEEVPLFNDLFKSENDKVLRFNIISNLELFDAEKPIINFHPDSVRKDFLRGIWHIKDEGRLEKFDELLQQLMQVSVTSKETNYEDILYKMLLDVTARKKETGVADLRPEKAPTGQTVTEIPPPQKASAAPAPETTKTPGRKSAKKPAEKKQATRQTSLTNPKKEGK